MLETLNHYLTFYLMFPLIFIVGVYFTLRLRFIQITGLSSGLSSLMSSNQKSAGDISNFEAIATVLAGNLGTGNISGIAVAIAAGGPGALVWMWVMAFFGAVIQFAGCLLGVKYRSRNQKNEFVGGPMYYLSKGLGAKKLAGFFCIFAIIGSITCGNLVQVNSLALPLNEIGLSPLLIGFLVALSVGYVIIGGEHRVALVASNVVPFMAALYVTVACLILSYRYEEVLPALSMMFSDAFDFSALFGGAAGFSISRAIASGFERGIFATDAGSGLAPILQASARAKSAYEEGIVAMVAPLVVMIICTLTGLVLIVTKASEIEGLKSTLMCTWAFEEGVGHVLGKYVVVVSLVLFAFTTILAWAYCAERAVEYLFGLAKVPAFRWFYIAIIPLGTIAHVELVWHLADLALAFMVATNLIGIVGLSRQVFLEDSSLGNDLEETRELLEENLPA